MRASIYAGQFYLDICVDLAVVAQELDDINVAPESSLVEGSAPRRRLDLVQEFRNLGI
jgi:hypothetical protein